MKITDEDINVKEDDSIIETLDKWDNIIEEHRKEKEEGRHEKQKIYWCIK